MKWGRILLAGVGVPAAAFLLVMLAATGYAFKLAFAVRGAPDQALIGQFAAHVGRSYGWMLQSLLTVAAAVWAARTVQESRVLHGVSVGGIVGGAGLVVAGTLSVRTLAVCALTVGAGWLGGALAARRGARQDRGRPAAR